MAEPTPGRPGQTGSGPSGPRSATAATFVVNDSSLRDMHATWRNLIKDVKEFNAELQNLGRGAKTIDQLAAKLGQLSVGGGGGGGAGGRVGGRLPGMPPVPVNLGTTIPVGSSNYAPPLPGQGGVPNVPGEGSAGTGGTPALAGGASPWARAGKIAGGTAKAALAVGGATALFYGSRMTDISDSDLFFNQQAQNRGYGYRGADKGAARNAMFGAPGGRGFGSGVTGYQSVQDLLGGANTIFGATGGTSSGRGMSQLRAAGQLSSLTPNAGLAGSSQAVASLYDPTMSARLNAIGVGPSVGLGGQLQSPQAIYQRVLTTIFRGQRPTAQMITEGLQPGAPLYVTLTQGLGLGPDAIEQFARYAIAQANLGGDFARTNRAIADAARGRSTADTRRAGLNQSVRANQNLAGAAGARQTVEAGREGEHALETGFGRLADATDTLTNTFKQLNSATGGKSGDLLGGAGVFGGPVTGLLNSVGGIGGSLFAAQGLKGLFARGGVGGAARGGGLLARLGLGGAAEGGVAGGAEAGAVAAGGGGLAAVAAPVGIAIAAAFVGHITGEALKSNAQGKKGIAGAVEDIVGTSLASAWKVGIHPVGYFKDMYAAGKRHHFAAGGVVPGQHDRDDVNIKATPGELVVPKNVVHRFGGADALMSRLGFHGHGAFGHYASGGKVTGKTEGLNSSFLGRLEAWAAAEGENFNIVSGYRSYARQQELYNGWIAHKPGYNLAAKPGESNHNFGLAADGPPWGNRHPERFGLRYAVEGENWHVEPVNAKAMRGGASMASGSATGDSGNLGSGASGTAVPDGGAAGNGNIAQAPGVMANESSIMSAFLSRSNAPYGTAQMPNAVSTPPPNASGMDSTSTSTTVQAAPSNPTGNIALGRQKAAARGWTGTEWDSLYQLWNKESSWRTDASNPTSSARGIAQTMMSVHFGKNWQKDKKALSFLSDPNQQIDWGLNYIAQRYSRPSAAWAHSREMNWYEKGAWETDDEVARLHKDEMVVPANVARKMRRAVRDRGADVQTMSPAAAGRAGVTVNIDMSVQLGGQATQQDAKHLVTMMKAEMEQDDTLMLLGSGG